MAKLVTLRRERRSENWIRENQFIVQESVSDPEAALRAAIREYLLTPDGQQAIEDTSEDFNWGDAMNIPDEFWNAHGLSVLYDGETAIFTGVLDTIDVDQDEVLCWDCILDEEEEEDE